MTELGVVYRTIQRADKDVAARLGALGSATVHEAMGRTGLLKPYMRPIYPRAQASGTAVTVLLHPGDNWMMHVAAEQIRPGDVVWFPPNVRHWHGASPTTAMTRIAIQERLDGKAVDWLEHVTDGQYAG